MIDNEVSLRNLEFEQNKLDDSGPSNGTGNADKSTIHGRKRWHVLRHIMNTSNFLKTSDEHNPTENSGHRDSFMERFSVQRRGSFAKQRQEQNSDGTLEQNEDQFVNKEQQSVNLQDNTNIQKELASNEKKVKGVQSQQRVNALPLIQSDQASSGSSSTVSLRMLQDQEKFREFDGEFCILPFIFDPDSWAMMLWLTLVAVAVLYNLWFAIARQAFTELQSKHSELWYSLDGIADLIYILDFVAQIGTTYLECGLTVLNRRKMAWRYIRSIDFRLDILSVVPMDMLQFHFGVQPMLRFPRFIKIYRAQEWKSKVENRSIFPNLWRVINLIHILFLGCHWFASVYFIISRYENFAYSWNYQPSVNLTAGDWTWRAYLKCFYWATLALTTIGIEHEPITDIE
ncbi:unnamed protein product [Calicophoron daubneyi]|uniref:Ion transport domain-containing protein n=1 Tax=Calicophoron daubneyi TaxID=300641 RepID=A0AAV2TF50_CALDB